MNEDQREERDQEPGPIEHSDAERVTAEESAQVPSGEDADHRRDENDRESS